MKRETLQNLVRFLLSVLTDTRFEGLENLPETGGVIIATNHMSRLDIPVLLCNPRRPDITALVADKYRRYSFFAWFARTAGAIWLDREKADFAAFRAAAEVLAEGRSLGIAPEGTRSTTGQLLQGKPGTVLVAVRTGMPIVPVGIHGTEDGMKKISTFRRPKIVAKFGELFRIPPIDREQREAQMQYWTDEIMLRIAVLLPEKYHGFYAGYPRIRELMPQGER